MTIDLKILKEEMLAAPDGEARSLKLSDQLGNAYGQVTWVWGDNVLSVHATKLPNGYEGCALGVEDMAAISLEGQAEDWRDVQAQDLALQLLLWGIAVVPSPHEAGAARPAIEPISLEIDTARGVALVQVSCDGAFIQIHVMHACHQPPFFVVLGEAMASKVQSTVKALIEGDPLPSDANITDRVEGAVQAGTAPRVVSVSLGGMPVAQAEQLQ